MSGVMVSGYDRAAGPSRQDFVQYGQPDGHHLRRRPRHRCRDLRDRRCVPPPGRVTRPHLPHPRRAGRHRRYLGSLPVPGRPVRQRHAHPGLRVQALELREVDCRRPVDHGVSPRDRGRVRHRPPHPVRPSRASRRMVDRDGDLDRRRRDRSDGRTPDVHVQLPVDVFRVLLVPPRLHTRLRRPRPLPGPHRPSAAVAGGSRPSRANEWSSSVRAPRR